MASVSTGKFKSAFGRKRSTSPPPPPPKKTKSGAAAGSIVYEKQKEESAKSTSKKQKLAQDHRAFGGPNTQAIYLHNAPPVPPRTISGFFPAILEKACQTMLYWTIRGIDSSVSDINRSDLDKELLKLFPYDKNKSVDESINEIDIKEFNKFLNIQDIDVAEFYVTVSSLIESGVQYYKDRDQIAWQGNIKSSNSIPFNLNLSLQQVSVSGKDMYLNITAAVMNDPEIKSKVISADQAFSTTIPTELLRLAVESDHEDAAEEGTKKDMYSHAYNAIEHHGLSRAMQHLLFLSENSKSFLQTCGNTEEAIFAVTKNMHVQRLLTEKFSSAFEEYLFKSTEMMEKITTEMMENITTGNWLIDHALSIFPVIKDLGHNDENIIENLFKNFITQEGTWSPFRQNTTDSINAHTKIDKIEGLVGNRMEDFIARLNDINQNPNNFNPDSKLDVYVISLFNSLLESMTLQKRMVELANENKEYTLTKLGTGGRLFAALEYEKKQLDLKFLNIESPDKTMDYYDMAPTLDLLGISLEEDEKNILLNGMVLATSKMTELLSNLQNQNEIEYRINAVLNSRVMKKLFTAESGEIDQTTFYELLESLRNLVTKLNKIEHVSVLELLIDRPHDLDDQAVQWLCACLVKSKKIDQLIFSEAHKFIDNVLYYDVLLHGELVLDPRIHYQTLQSTDFHAIQDPEKIGWTAALKDIPEEIRDKVFAKEKQIEQDANLVRMNGISLAQCIKDINGQNGRYPAAILSPTMTPTP
ncbi:hypothetical protein CL657_04685 [bacterium]|nr:hypothetical protein [bacterium]